MAHATDASTPWWGSVSLAVYTGGQWEIGPSTLWVYRSTHDWRIVHRPSTDPVTADPMAQHSDVAVPLPDDEMTAVLEADEPDLITHRYGVRDTDETVALRPALADRPVVARPEHPISVLPKESVTLYLSTPLWARVELVESERRLHEVPSHRMSDTWFGPTTRTGELCYATRTAGRLRLDRVPVRLHRALTPLQVQNEAPEALALERVQLPAPHLSLYETDQDGLWTEAVTMIRRAGEPGADIRIAEGAPSEVDTATRVQEPRETTKQGLITSTFSAFGALFGP
jgi:hypothetical protein